MNKILKGLSLFLGIALSINVFLIAFEFLAFNAAYYRSEFDTLDVAESIGISSDYLHHVSDSLVHYIDDGSGNLMQTVMIDGKPTVFFNAKERQHLEDIRLLVIAFRRFLFVIQVAILVGLLFLYYGSGKNLIELIAPLKIAFWTAIALLLFLLSLYFIDFDWAFRRFHEIFFNNDLWLLNPATDRLIQMMPLDFFIRFTKHWLLIAGTVHLLMLGAYQLLKRLFTPHDLGLSKALDK